MSTGADDFFSSIMGGKSFYTFDEFQERLDAYQKESATCFVVVASYSAEQSNRNRGSNIPVSARYYRATFRCVHGVSRDTKKSRVARKHRFVPTACPAKFILRYINGMLRIVDANLKHNHNFQSGRPWLYPQNRRLTKEQEEELEDLLDIFKSDAELKRYIISKYQIYLNNNDILKLRQSSIRKQQPINGVDSPDDDPSENKPIAPTVEQNPSCSNPESADLYSDRQSRSNAARDMLNKLYQTMMQLDVEAFTAQLDNLCTLDMIMSMNPLHVLQNPFINT